jgi:hypothetical protein
LRLVNNFRQSAATSAPCGGAELRKLHGLFIPGDQVTIQAEDPRVYRIVHVSRQKAWISPVLGGEPRIIPTGDLVMTGAGALPAAELH